LAGLARARARTRVRVGVGIRVGVGVRARARIGVGVGVLRQAEAPRRLLAVLLHDGKADGLLLALLEAHGDGGVPVGQRRLLAIEQQQHLRRLVRRAVTAVQEAAGSG